MLTDLLTRPIKVGDIVLTNYHYSTTMGELSEVKKVTKKAVYVEVKNRYWGFTSSGLAREGGTKLLRRRPDQVLVIDQQLAYNRKHFPEAYL